LNFEAYQLINQNKNVLGLAVYLIGVVLCGWDLIKKEKYV